MHLIDDEFNLEMEHKYGKYNGFSYIRRIKKTCEVTGRGVSNDVEFYTSYKNNGVKITHPAYSTWLHIIKKCRTINGKFNNCEIHKDWLSLKLFSIDFKSMYRDGFCINKDLILCSNKIYSKDTCVFIPKSIHSWIYTKNKGGKCSLLGVTYDRGVFIATIKCGEKNKKIGRFKHPIDAHKAWQKHKKQQAIELLKKGFPVKLIVERLSDDIENNRITTSLVG